MRHGSIGREPPRGSEVKSQYYQKKKKKDLNLYTSKDTIQTAKKSQPTS
jgi:hypothetical protein